MIEPRDRVRNPALLVVDMQNDFVRVGAALEVVDARATIPANKALIEFFRARKLPVVYTKFITFPAPVLLQVEKFNYGAFHATTLEPILRSMGVESVVVTGTVTQICVEETARQAFHHGFRTTLVRDAVSSFAPDLHAATLKNFASKVRAAVMA